MSNVILGGFEVEISRKRVKNINLRIVPPDGKIIVSSPFHVNRRFIESFIISRSDWIRRKQEEVKRASPSSIKYLDGDTIYLFGEPYRLQIYDQSATNEISISGNNIVLKIKEEGTVESRSKMLNDWFALKLKPVLDDLVASWEPEMGVKINQVKIRDMKTRWGSCNPVAGRIWINLSMAHKPLHLIEYIVVHEMTHMLERGHNSGFYKRMDQWMPAWKKYRKELREGTNQPVQ